MIFDALVAGHIRRHSFGVLLTTVAIAFGVASYVATGLTGTFADRAIATSVVGASVHADIQVFGVTKRLNRSTLRTVRDVPGVLEARPVIEASATLRTARASEVVHVRAIDALQSFPGSNVMRAYEPGPFAPPGPLDYALIERNGVVLTRSLANQLGLSNGSTVRAVAARTPITLRVVAVVPSLVAGLDADTVLIDLRTASKLLGDDTTLDRIDVVRDGAATLATIEHGLRLALPPDTRVERSDERIASLERLTDGFSTNATVLAYVALALGAVLVANSIGISVRRRRPEIATLRSLGATRTQIARAFVIEGALLGALGGTVGASIGEAFALAAAGAGDAAALLETGSQLAADTARLVEGIGIGFLLSLVAAIAPAIEAASVLPATALRVVPAGAAPGTRRRFFSAGVGLTLASLAAAYGSAPGDRIDVAYGSALGSLAGIGLCVPLLLASAVRFGHRAAARLPVAAHLALARIRANAGRLGLASVTLVLAVTASVGVATATASFRKTIDSWALRDVPGDLQVRPFGIFDAGRARTLRVRLARVPGVAQVAASSRHAQYFGSMADSLFIVARPSVSLASLRRTIVAASPVAVDVRFSRDARAADEDRFGASLSLASAIGGVSIVIAIVSTVATIFALVAEQQREFALLRVLGLARTPMRHTIVFEALVLSAFGAFLGDVAGVALGAMLVLVIDPLVSGYSATFVLPLGTALLTPVAVILVATLAAFVPIRLASAPSTLRAIQS